MPPNPSSSASPSTRTRLQHALALQQQGKLAQAGAIYMDILKTEPDHPDCLHLLGLLAARAGNHQAALALIDHAIAAFPGDASFHNNRGNVLRDLGQPELALASYDQAIALRADDAEAHYNRGVTLHDLGRFDAAVASYDTANTLRASYADAWYNRGNALQALAQYAAAIDSYDRAIATAPDAGHAYANRGNARAALQQFDAALADFDRAIAIAPDVADSHYNRGVTLRAIGQFDAALASFQRAVALRPDHADAQWNLALVRLLTGDLREGFARYESRWQTQPFAARQRSFTQPLWLGDDPLAGKTLLVHNDQGLGDAIQFSRYARQLAHAGAYVIVEVARPLVPLLGTLDGVAQVIATGDTLPAFDCHCPMTSLPLACSADLSNVPADVGYLRGDARKASAWAEQLGARHRPRVGLVVSGNPHHRNDAHRSIPLAHLLRYLPTGIDYVLMQKDLRDADRAALASRPDIRVVGDQLHDFSDTAALCMQLDVVISVDTSVAHLAGALGRPTWILLPFVPDWRWLLHRDDSPWYPTARLYRQPARGDWDAVCARVGAHLAQWAGEASPDT